MSRNGESVSPLNIEEWHDFALRSRLIEALDMQVYVEGDARALALAEGVFGGATHDDSYASLVVSTGIGGAVVLDGRLLSGESGNAGHIGHLRVRENGRLCSCGSYGCLEAEASGWAIQGFTGRPAREADAVVRHACAEDVGHALGTLSSVFDFSHSYVAGSVALGFGDEFFEIANKAARQVAMLEYSSDVEIRPSGLGIRWSDTRRCARWLERCGSMTGVRWGHVLRHLALHPGDIVVLTRCAWRFRENGWWRRAPFLPLPSNEYWEFRLVTAMGSQGEYLSSADMVQAAKWSLRQRVGR